RSVDHSSLNQCSQPCINVVVDADGVTAELFIDAHADVPSVASPSSAADTIDRAVVFMAPVFRWPPVEQRPRSSSRCRPAWRRRKAACRPHGRTAFAPCGRARQRSCRLAGSERSDPVPTYPPLAELWALALGAPAASSIDRLDQRPRLPVSSRSRTFGLWRSEAP